MSTTRKRPLHDSSNSHNAEDFSVRAGHNIESKKRRRYSLYPVIHSSTATTSDHSSIYNASIARSSRDENDSGAEGQQGKVPATGLGNSPDGNEAKANTSPSGVPQLAPPVQPATPNSPNLIEARFSNRPDGTPLATILERKSSLSLHQRLSNISAKRSFTAAHVHPESKYLHVAKPLASAGEVEARLSLDEAAVRKLGGVRHNASSSDAEPTPLGGTTAEGSAGDRGRQLHMPQNPPFRQARTPPGQPRWPGDLKTAGPEPSNSFTRALRNLVSSPSIDNAQLLRGQIRGRGTSNSPRRVGQAFWQPPRSAHLTASFNGPRHPFHNAPTATPVSRPSTAFNTPRSRTSGSPVGAVRIDGASCADVSTTSVDTFAPETSPNWTRSSTLMADIIAGFGSIPTRRPSQSGSPVRRRVVTLPTAMSIIPVRKSSVSLGLETRSTAPLAIDETPVVAPLEVRQRSPSTNHGIIDVASPMTDPCRQEHNITHTTVAAPFGNNRLHETESTSNADCRHSATGKEGIHVRWAEEPVTERPRAPPSSIAAAPEQHAEERRIVSAALPVLLPIAAREGIVRPLRLVLHHEQDGEGRSARNDQASQSQSRTGQRSTGRDISSMVGERDASSFAVFRSNARSLAGDSRIRASAHGEGPATQERSKSRRRLEKGIALLLERCFCQPRDADSTECTEIVRVVATQV